jgi:hypothetical protein
MPETPYRPELLSAGQPESRIVLPVTKGRKHGAIFFALEKQYLEKNIRGQRKAGTQAAIP